MPSSEFFFFCCRRERGEGVGARLGVLVGLFIERML